MDKIAGIVLKPYWGFKVGDTIKLDFNTEINDALIGIYDSNDKFVVYVSDKEMLDECVNYNHKENCYNQDNDYVL